MITVVVDVDDLVEFVVVEHRPRQHDLPARRGGGLEQILLRSHHSRQRRHDLFSDGVEWRVRDLREQFDEVVVQLTRSLGHHRGRGVGPHRSQWLAPGGGHRGEHDAEIFLGVAEGDLSANHGLVVVLNVGALGQALDFQQSGVQPFLVRMFLRQLQFDLLVGNETPGDGVDQKHLARLEATLGDDLRLRHVQDTCLAGEDHPTVGRLPPPTGAQTVAIENGPDVATVGERDAGRTVPRFHHRRVELIERPYPRIHRAMVLPRLRHHHHHDVGNAPAAQMQQFEHLVERHRIGGVGIADGEEPLQITGDEIAGQHCFPSAHPVPVALHRVDLSVVRDVAVRVRQRPRREGIGGKATVHDGNCTRTQRVTQLREEQGQLHGGEHALVDDGACGQRREEQARALCLDLRGDALRSLTQPVHQSVEFETGRT